MRREVLVRWEWELEAPNLRFLALSATRLFTWLAFGLWAIHSKVWWQVRRAFPSSLSSDKKEGWHVRVNLAPPIPFLRGSFHKQLRLWLKIMCIVDSTLSYHYFFLACGKRNRSPLLRFPFRQFPKWKGKRSPQRTRQPRIRKSLAKQAYQEHRFSFCFPTLEAYCICRGLGQPGRLVRPQEFPKQIKIRCRSLCWEFQEVRTSKQRVPQ